jgi:hypothetical protein
MPSSRTELQAILKGITENVYFQPPNSVSIQYPCIRYERSGSELEHADNRLYRHTKRYQVTVIDRNPDSPLPDQVIALPMCSFDRYFASDDLNHYVFTLFF